MSLYRDVGVVLRTYRLGEADRIVVLLTPEHGKVRAVAKGARRTKSRFGGRLEPLNHLSLLMWQGRGELEVISQAETIDHWPLLHEDLSKLTSAIALLEATDAVAQEGQPSAELYTMLVGALRAVSAHHAPLVVAGFFWKLLSLDGAHPVLDRCARCGLPSRGLLGRFNEHEGEELEVEGVDLISFDLGEGGALCRSCRSGMSVSQECLDMLGRMLGGDLRGALRVGPGRVADEMSVLATTSLEGHLERRLKAARALQHS